MMKILTSRSLKGIFFSAPTFTLIIILTFFFTKSYAQTRTLASTVSIQDHVDNPQNATGDNNNFATVNSYGGLALGLGRFNGELELKFPTTLTGGTTSYIRIDFDGDILNALLGGNLGGLLANVVGNVALGNHSFEVGARNSAGNTVLSGSSTAAFSSSNLRLIKDANGFFFVAITPTQAYDRIYVRDITNALLLGVTNNTKVYYAFHTSGTDACAPAFATGYEGTGITLDALQLGSSGVTNPERAIDSDPTNFSQLSLGVLAVGGSISQNFYFTTPSNAGDEFNLSFSSTPALLNAGVLNGIFVTAYNGNTEVYNASASSVLNLDLLGLLNNGQIASVPFSPGVPFDRVKVTLASVVNLNLTQTIQVYGVTRSAGRPTFTSPASNAISTCYNSSANLTATTTNANELIWYDVLSGGTALQTVAYNGTFTTPALIANKTYYVAARRIGCTSESGRVAVVVTVNPQIIFNGATLTNATNGFSYSKQLDVATGGTPTYTYALASGSSLPAGLSLSASGLINGTPSVANTYTFSVVAKDSKNCTTTANFTLTVTPTLALLPGALPDGVTGTIYPTQIIPSATGGTGPYTYVATGLPPGLTFDNTTREINGTPTVVGQYTIPVTATDANGNSITASYTIKVTDPLILPAATLANGTTGTIYTTQIIPSATGGTTPYTYSATNLPQGLTFNTTTRAITGTPGLAGTFTFPVSVVDNDGRTVTTNYTINVIDPLVLPGALLPDGTEGVAYTSAQPLPAATGGTGPYTYVENNLPPGLTFDRITRQISGTPTQAGNYNIGVTVTDATNKTASNTYAIKVNGTLSLPTRTLPNGIVGTSYLPQTLPAVSGGTSPYTYAATGLPPGLTFNNTTREITGTPTQGGTYTVSQTATDSNNNKATTTYTIIVTVNAPVVASATVCSGSAATLTVSNVQANVTYNLYASTGSTAIATNNTGIFTTPAVTSSTVFYIEAVSGTAVSSRTSVTVSVNPPATLATITTNNQVINAGQNTTLSATADAGNTITWFDTATGGNQVGSGTNFTTPNLTISTTYYVQTTSSNGCLSTTRVPVTVIVITGGGAACNAASSQNTGINGICLLCGITGAGNSTDANTANFTRISLAVGVTATGYQQLIFPSVGLATDSVRLDLALPSGLADLGLLGNVTVTILNGSTVVKTVQLNSSLLNLTVLGGNRFTATVLAGGIYDRVQVSFGSLVTAVTSLDVYGATVIYPNPTVTAGAQAICSGSTATLSATANGATTLTWFDAATGGTQVGAGPNFTTPTLTATATYYIQVNKGTCANALRIPIVVTVNPAIIFNGTTLTNATIASPYSKQLPVATGGTPGYTYTLAVGSALPAGLTLSSSGLVSGTPSATGTPTFSVVAADTKNCSTTAVFNLTVTPALALSPGALPDGVTGTPYTTNGIPSATGGTGPYTYTAIGVPTGLTFNATTREITGTPSSIGDYSIPVTVTDANGNTITSNYTLKVTDPLILPPATLANGTTGTVYTTQIIPSATGGKIPYTYTAINLPPGLNFNNTTREVSGTPSQSGTFTFPVTVTDAAGKTATTNYAVNIIDPLLLPGALLPDGTEGTIYTNQTLPSATGGVSPYTYVASNLPLGLAFNTTTREISGTPTQAGNYSIGVTVTDQNNRTASNNYSIKIVGVLALPPATLPNGIVGTSYPTQTLPAVTGGTGPYSYLATNLPPGLSFNTTTREITGTPTLGGTFTISLTATDFTGNKATTAYSLTVNVNPPVVASATVCSGSSATLSVSNLLTNVTYNWYASTGSTPLATNNTGIFVTPIVTSQTVFYVESVSGTAVSSRTAVTVSVNPSATLATVTTNNQVINAGQATTLSATADAGNTIAWFDAPTGGTQVGTGSSFTTPALSTTTTYYVETTSPNGCVSASRVPVTVTVINGGGGTACNAANTQSTGISGICVLCQIAGAGNSTDADPTNFTRISLAVGVGATGYQQLIFPALGSATDSLRLDLALPGGLLDLTALGNVTINVMNGTSVVRTVQLNSSLLNLQLLSGNRFTATVLAGGVYDRVQISFGALVTALTSLDIYGATAIYPNPTVTAGAQTICSGSTATLTATANGGTTLAWFDAATGGTQVGTGASFTTPALTTTTTYYIQVSKGTCANVTRVPVIVTVTPAIASPVLATIANVCEGSTATLSVANPDAALTYRWYNVATGGTSIFTGSVFQTTALSTNTTYYVEAAQGNCVSAARTAAAVTVNPRPILPAVTASATTVSPGQTAILTASSTDATNTFNWYTSANATTPIYTGSTYVTPPLLATTTYYVESVSTNGCTAASRVQVTITVDTNGAPNPVPCEAATTQASGVTGVALLAGVFNPALAIDNDTQTASSLVMPVGALNASVFQRVGFGSLSKVGDTVRVLVSSPGRLLSLALLGNTQITTYVGANSNGDSRLLNSNLLNVQLLSGNTQALITFVPTTVFDGVEVRLNSGILGALTSVNLNYAQRILVAPTVASSNVTACVGQTAQLEVSNPSSSLTYKWYDAAGTYLTGKDGIIFTTPVLTGDTKFFVAAVSASGCVSYKTVVNVTTNPAPVAPALLSASVNTCPNTSVTLQISNPIVGSTYNWYDTATSTTVLFTGDNFTTPLITANRSYFVAAVNACGTSSTRTEATIILGTIDIPVITPSAITISENSVAVLKATSSTAGATINWYTVAVGGAPIFTGETFVTPQLTATTTYYVEATVPGGCTATSRATVTVTVVPNGTPVTAPCGAAINTVASGVTGIAIGAGVINPTLAVDNNSNTGSSLVIPVGLLGSSVYHQVGFNGLSNVGDTLRVKITIPGQLLTLALLPNLTVTTFQGTTSNNDAVLVSNPLINLRILSGGSSAILTYIPTSRFDGVELRLNSGILGALTSINFDYAQRTITAPIVGSAVASACQGSSATLNVSNPQAGIVYKWYLNGAYQTGKDGVSFTTDPTLTAGTYTYSVTATATATGCETKGTEVVVTILSPPAPPVAATNPATTCIGTPVTLNVQAVAGVTFNWYDAAINGNLLVNNSSSFTTSASLTAGTYDYYVEAVNGNSCTNPTRTKVSITVNPSAIASDITVTGSTSLCSAGTTVLVASSTTVTNPVFTWYNDAALTSVAFVGASFTTPAITANTKYYVTVSGTNKCANTPGNAKEVSITVNPVAIASDIVLSGTSTICGGSSVTLNATSTTVVNPIFTWYSDANLTTVVQAASPQFVTPNLVATTTYYVTVKGDNKCENTPATAKSITITVNPIATDADLAVSGTTTVCKGSTAALSASTTTVTNPTFTWYNDAALTSVAHIGATFTTPALTSTTSYYVTIKGDNRCENLAGTAEVVTITVKEFATAADITVSNAQICSGSTVILMASSLTVTQPVFTWYSDASLTSVAFVGPTFSVPGLTTTTTYYVTVKGANKCENSAADAKVVTVTVNPLATTTDIIVNGNTVACSGSSAVLTATSPTVTNPIFTWYADAALTNVSFVGSVFTTPVLSGTTTYYVTVKGDNKCENAAGNGKVVTITVSPVATASDITANDATICARSSTTIIASSTTVTNPTFTWYNDAALTSVAHVGSSFLTPVLTATTKYYITVKGDNKCENSSSTAKVVTVNVNQAATAADITLSTPTIVCGSGTALINASSTTVTSPVFTWYNDASLTSVAFVGPIFTTPILTANTTYYVTVKGINKCENSAADAKVITIVVNPIAVASDVVVNGSTSICGGSSAILTASSTTVTNPVFTWYTDAALTNVAFTGSVFTTPILTANTTYYVTVKGDNKCENSAATAKVISITLNPTAVASDITAANATICAGSSVILSASSTTVTNPIFTWYSNAALTNVSFVGAVFTTPSLTANTTYYLTVKGDNKCENTTATAKLVTVTVNSGATLTDVIAADATICAGSSAVLSASSTTVTNPVFTWYSDAALTTPVFSGTVFNTPTLTTTTKYYLTVKGDNKCESSSANARVVTVNVNIAATAADITLSAPAIICSTGSVVINASSTTVTNPIFTWYNDSSLTSVAFVGPTFTTPVLTSSTTYYVTVKGSNNCENSSGNAKPVTIIVNPTALASDVSVNGSTSICASSAAILTATSTTVINPIFTWYSDAALGNVVFTGSVFTTPTLTASTTYYVTVKGDNKCENTAATAKSIVITVNALPNNPIIAGAGNGICAGDAVTLSVTNPQTGVIYEWYNAALGGNLLFTGISYTTPTLTATVDYYISALGATGCTNNAGRVKVSVTVTPKPTAPTVVSSTVNVCIGNPIVLAVSNPQTGLVYNWYNSASGGTILGNGTTFTTPVVTANTTYYVEAASGSCISSARTAVNIIALPVPVAPASVTAANGIICAGSSTILTVNNPTTGLIYRWYASSSGGTFLFEGITFTTPALSATTTYYVESIAIGGCASPTRTAITVNVLPVLTKPVVVVESTTASSVTFAWAAVQGATGYEVSLNNGLNWILPTNGATGTSYTALGLKPNQSITIIVRAKGQIDCQTSANSNPVTGKATNPFGNQVFVPNAFTPNNDGKNDTFLIFGNTIASAKMSVFTQWGQLIFQSDNIANGWDGTFKGVNQPIGVYVYMVDITFSDGTSTMKKGTVTLIR